MGKYFRKNKIKINIPIRVAAVLLCLTLVLTYLVSGLFARYVTSSESSSSARVAKFSIEGEGILSESIAVSLAPGGYEEKTFSIKNNSEVSVEYTVEVAKMTNNLPLELSMKKKDSSSTEEESNTKFIVRQDPGSHTDEYTLHIEWPQAEDANGDVDNLARIGMVDHIVVTVTAVQID